MSGVRASARRKLFAPTPITSSIPSSAAVVAADEVPKTVGKSNGTNGANQLDDAALAAVLSAADSRRSYSLRRRVATTSTPAIASSGRASPRNMQKNGIKTAAATATAKRARSPRTTASEAEDSELGSDFSDDAEGSTSDDDSDVFTASPRSDKKGKAKITSATATISTPKRTRKTAKRDPEDATSSRTRKSSSASPKKTPASPFDVSPRKPTRKPIKVNLLPHEAHPAPPNWEIVYNLLSKQRSKIIAPVDTMGCEENGREDRRADSWRSSEESPEDAAKRERLATLVSLMLSSQTKDPVTAEAVYNLQRTLPNGLCLQSLLEADDSTISSCIAKVGFWRRKTGYLKSAARILQSDFDGDVPKTVDELCSLPGVGPKMAFLALSSMGIQIGIGVDTHVHRLTNRLGWHNTKTPEETRLNLQSWLPQELHGKINRLLVGFGQVICVPVGPRCDLCTLGGGKGLCPSERKVDEKSALKRVKVDLLDSDDDMVAGQGENWVKTEKAEAKVKVEMEFELDGPDGKAALMKVGDLTKPMKGDEVIKVKKEQSDEEEALKIDAATVDKALEW
ncbi:related to NTG1 - DNA repair protein [Ustilago trichophora]|uniref:Endonuclease III homolog n=1 Tax=Ustilago trichophora TaxID=86804 RepID=A0A5C3EE32_9BASI|nr:related to NTG1 - DNA repair protein [Ustilago trichophora]